MLICAPSLLDPIALQCRLRRRSVPAAAQDDEISRADIEATPRGREAVARIG